jgi:hypothetical protein
MGPTLGAEDDGHVGLALGVDGGVDLEDALQVLRDTGSRSEGLIEP